MFLFVPRREYILLTLLLYVADISEKVLNYFVETEHTAQITTTYS